MNILDQLRAMSVVVADTGSVEAVKAYSPVDCTTNPSLVLAALGEPEAAELLAREITKGHENGLNVDQITDTLPAAMGATLAALVTGRVSTEVDARLSFDTEGSVQRARAIIADYAARGIGKDRILIKLAATWEGIRAAEILQAEGIDCNLTLVFSLAQAVACADAGVFLISPFVGRITDWHMATSGKESYAPEEDPGVLSVRRIYDYYKANGIETIVMGASFRNVGQVKALAGCDRLTISPKLLEALAQESGTLERCLDPQNAGEAAPIKLDEAAFRWEMNADAMATEKLAEGIRKFDADLVKLKSLVADRL